MPALSRYLCVSNLGLRLLWTYKLSPHLRHNHATVMAFTLLEAFRRFQWMFVRTEVGPDCKGLQTSAAGCAKPAPSFCVRAAA